MSKIIENYRDRKPYLVHEWNDTETNATGWFVRDSLYGGACGGGTRMSKDVTREQVEYLAKTMGIKHRAYGFNISGAKSGIRFDPNDGRKLEVLERFYKSIEHDLQSYYGTGGDLNVSMDEVSAVLDAIGIKHPQYGIVWAKYRKPPVPIIARMERLAKTNMQVVDKEFTPMREDSLFTYQDLVTGYGVYVATEAAFQARGHLIKDKRILIQGFGVVGAAAAFYLAKAGAKIVGIQEKEKSILGELSLAEITEMYIEGKKSGDFREAFYRHYRSLWNVDLEKTKPTPFFFTQEYPVDAFIPCAASGIVQGKDVSLLLKDTQHLTIVCGANNPFANDGAIYGDVSQFFDSDPRYLLVPDFIANMGMARLFYFLMDDFETKVTQKNVFADISKAIHAHFHEVPKTGFACQRLEAILKK